MAIETVTPSTALITSDIVLFGLIAATLGLIFWLASGPTPFWKKFFAWVPALLLCYFVPAFYNTVGLIDGEHNNLYNPIASRVLLPAALVCSDSPRRSVEHHTARRLGTPPRGARGPRARLGSARRPA